MTAFQVRWPPEFLSERSDRRSPPRRTTTVYDHRRQNFEKHAAYVVVAFVAGG